MITFKEFVFGKNSIKLISEDSNYNLTEIKYLSPDGKEECPQGHYFAKGGWHKTVRINENSFIINNKGEIFGEALADEQFGLPDYNGGIIVFSTDVNDINSSNKTFKGKIKAFFKNNISTIINRLRKNKKLTKIIKKHNKQEIEDYFVGAFSIGKFFTGRYLSKSGDVFDEKSTSIEINGVPSEVLFLIGTEIANDFQQETVLIKDLNKNKFYLADRKRVKDIKKEIDKI